MVGNTLLHYEVLQEISAGAMGVTYLARDQRLDRHVVLKFLSRHAGDSDTRLSDLENEARSLARLSHPHIASVHALEHGPEGPFLVIEYVEGETLRAALGLGALPADEVIRLGRALAAALAHAHEHGVLHRDVKPENILVDESGHVRLADFGVARLLGHDRAGDVSGTHDYMPPEQAQGLGGDPRSDLYALGVVLYEALVGARPSPAERRGEIPLAPPGTLAAGVPPALDALVMRCLAPSPRARPRSARDVAIELDRLAGVEPEAPPRRPRWHTPTAVAAGLTLALAVVLALNADVPGPARPGALVVAPFENLAPRPGEGYLGLAFARSLTTNLSHTPPLELMTPIRTGVLGAELREARARGAQWLVTGGLARRGSIVTITVRLVETRRGRVIWRVERSMRDRELGAFAGEVARSIADTLSATPPTAYDHFLHGVASEALAMSPLTAAALGAIRNYDEPGADIATQAMVAAYPDEPEARLLRSYSLLQASWTEGARSPHRPAFVASLAELRRLDPHSPWPDVLEGLVASRDGRLDAAVEQLTRVLDRHDLTPAARAHVLSLRGQAYRDLGQGPLALDDLHKAQRLDALNTTTRVILADALGTYGRLEEALECARQALALEPAYPYANLMFAQALGRLGRWNEAVAPAAEAARLSPEHAHLAFHALALEHAGRRAAADRVATRMAASPVSDWGLMLEARWRARRGDRDRALELAERAVAMGFRDPELPVFPEFVRYHDHPRFRALVEQVAPRVPLAPEPAASEAP